MSSQIKPSVDTLTQSTIESEVKTETVSKSIDAKVKAVVLVADGTTKEVEYEIAPKKHLAKDILGAPPTIIGEWDSIQVILVRGKHESLNVPLNQHQLRYPYNGRQFRGDILLYRVNKQGTAEDFTLAEYQSFASQPDKNVDASADTTDVENKQPSIFDSIAKLYEKQEGVEQDEEEEVPVVSQEELRREIAEAFEIIRDKGRHDAQYLAELVSETFYEINGREAELEDIASVFKRVKEQLAQEADEEVLDDSEEAVDEMSTTIKQLLTNESVKGITPEKREELLKQARDVVSQSLATQAREKFIQLSGREPSTQEFEDLLIGLSTTKLIEVEFLEDEDDSEYNPSEEEEQEQAREDEEADLEMESEKENDEEKANTSIISTDYETVPTEPLTEKKPIKFFSPVRTKKTPKQVNTGLDSVDRKLMDRVVGRFRSIHKREPTEQEQANLWNFLTTGGLPSYGNENTNTSNISQIKSSPKVKKLNLDSDEDDSDYVPEEEEEEDEDYSSPSEKETLQDEIQQDKVTKVVEIPTN